MNAELDAFKSNQSNNSSIAMVYLHGFLSSPQALKAIIVEQYLATQSVPIDYYRPAIADKPSQAIPVLIEYFKQLQQTYEQVIIVGSSLGGFYAHCMAELFHFKTVLVNPLVDASARMWHYSEEVIGQLENPYTLNTFSITAEDRASVDELEQACRRFNPATKLVLLQMGDEVLDAHLAARYYQQSCCMIAAGGNHQFEDFDQYTPLIFQWLGLSVTPASNTIK